jgi:3'-5' exoribonuclease 1
VVPQFDVPVSPGEMMFVVVDVEATCDNDGSITLATQEVIEIGAVLVSDAGEIGSEFSAFVRPKAKLTPFCTELTTITQLQVDQAANFLGAWVMFLRWLKGDCRFVSWGMFDWDLLKIECERSRVHFPFHEFVNLPHKTRHKLGTGSQRIAMKKLGIVPSGTRHRALDDAKNYARILSCLLEK